MAGIGQEIGPEDQESTPRPAHPGVSVPQIGFWGSGEGAVDWSPSTRGRCRATGPRGPAWCRPGGRRVALAQQLPWEAPGRKHPGPGFQ